MFSPVYKPTFASTTHTLLLPARTHQTIIKETNSLQNLSFSSDENPALAFSYASNQLYNVISFLRTTSPAGCTLAVKIQKKRAIWFASIDPLRLCSMHDISAIEPCKTCAFACCKLCKPIEHPCDSHDAQFIRKLQACYIDYPSGTASSNTPKWLDIPRLSKGRTVSPSRLSSKLLCPGSADGDIFVRFIRYLLLSEVDNVPDSTRSFGRSVLYEVFTKHGERKTWDVPLEDLKIMVPTRFVFQNSLFLHCSHCSHCTHTHTHTHCTRWMLFSGTAVMLLELSSNAKTMVP
jgi:hypothetical protein